MTEKFKLFIWFTFMVFLFSIPQESYGMEKGDEGLYGSSDQGRLLECKDILTTAKHISDLNKCSGELTYRQFITLLLTIDEWYQSHLMDKTLEDEGGETFQIFFWDDEASPKQLITADKLKKTKTFGQPVLNIIIGQNIDDNNLVDNSEDYNVYNSFPRLDSPEKLSLDKQYGTLCGPSYEGKHKARSVWFWFYDDGPLLKEPINRIKEILINTAHKQIDASEQTLPDNPHWALLRTYLGILSSDILKSPFLSSSN